MQRQHGSLVPVAEVVSGLNGPVKAIRDASPQALHHFTQADQVHQLVSASEADPDLGFMARLMALCCLPRTNPGDRIRYKRVNGPYTLYMTAGGGCKLPYGNIPRLLLAWLSTEAVRTQNRELVLGRSLAKFMRELGIYSSGGKPQTRLRNQMRRLFNAHVQLVYEDEHGEARVNNQSSGPARHEHPHGSQALRLGPRSLPLACLPHLRAPRSATAHLAAVVPTVRNRPGQSA